MSFNVNGISSNSDIQSRMIELFTKLNKTNNDGLNGLSREDLSKIEVDDNSKEASFIKHLEEQFDKIDKDLNGKITEDEVSYYEKNIDKLGIPAGMQIENDNLTDKLKNFKDVVNSVRHYVSKPIENIATTEAAGSIASLNGADGLKNLAGNYIQKLINSYKDNSQLAGLVSKVTSMV